MSSSSSSSLSSSSSHERTVGISWKKSLKRIAIAILCGLALVDVISLHQKALPAIVGAPGHDGPVQTSKAVSSLQLLWSKEEQLEQQAQLWKEHPEWISCKTEENDDSIPSFIIAGTQKGGTTALFHLLARHPLLEPAQYFEVHFFDWDKGDSMLFLKQELADLEQTILHPTTIENDLNATTSLDRLNQWTMALQQQQQQQNNNNNSSTDTNTTTTTTINSASFIIHSICRARQDYRRYFNLSEAVQSSPLPWMAYEKTPLYITSPKTPPLIKLVAPWTKIILMLRNPVDRAYSYYKMCRDTFTGDPCQRESFEDQIEQEMEDLIRRRNLSIPLLSEFREAMTAATAATATNTNTNTTTLDNNASSWHDSPLLFHVGNMSRFDMDIPPPSQRFRMNRYQRQGMVRRGLYAEQIHAWMDWFELGSSLLVVSHEAFGKYPTHVFEQILQFLNVPPISHNITRDHLLERHEIPFDKDSRFVDYKHPPLDPITRDYLTRFYKPYNQQLDDLLQQHEEWENMWT